MLYLFSIIMSNDQKKLFASNRLKFIREISGYPTAMQAARMYGWCYATYKSHEAGINPITEKAARKYAEAYGISMKWLLYGE